MSKDSMAACAKVHPTTEAKYSPENGVETSPSRSRSPDKGDALAGAEDSSIREELKQTAAPRRSSVALAEATKLEEMRGEWEPSNASATCLSGACARRLLCLLGVSNKRECYGERPLNTPACLLPDKKRRDYFQRDAEPDHEAIDTWWNLPWYEIPHLRHHWGEPQQPVHTGASDLFLDLVFVGVAYRVGVVLKAAFYSCKPADPYDFSGDESSSGETDTHFALPLRMMIGISVMLVFALQLLYSMVIRRRQLYHMSLLKLLRTQTAHCILVGMQLIALIAQALFGLIPLIPAHMIFGQAILGLIQCILLHLHEHKIKVTGTALHPLAAVPDALEALRLKSLKKRLLEQHQMNIASIAKIQSLGRKKLARQRSSLMRTTKAMS